MNKQMLEVMQRRGELQARITSQREQIAAIGSRLETPLAIADQGLDVIRFLRANPIPVAGVAALLIIRRRGTIGLIKIVWRAWKGYRYFTNLSNKLAARL